MKRASSRAKVAGRAHGKGAHSIHKKASAKKAGHGRPAKRSRSVEPAPPGYAYTDNIARILAPTSAVQPVEPSKIRRGISQAKQQLDETLDEILRTMAGSYEIKEIKLVASFNADGKFLGFGIGGAASMEITISPCEE